MIRALGKWIGRILVVIGGAFVALWLFGSREEIVLTSKFDPRKFGEGVQVYFESMESNVPNITPGVEKRVIWRNGFKEQRTPLSILYLHGFSATSEEIRPVPDQLAEALNANLVYTRLAGHGRDGAALATVTMADWMYDLAEGLAAARAVGEKVLILSTSTGGTLAVAAAADPALSEDIAGIIFVSPNLGINNPAAPLLTAPGARSWLPLLAGKTRSFEPKNDGQARYWTTSYPTVALLPMAALVRAVDELDVEFVRIPALFWLSKEDSVVRADKGLALEDRWPGPTQVQIIPPQDGMDPDNHVIAGDILSPGQTQAAVQGMLEWVHSRPELQ